MLNSQLRQMRIITHSITVLPSYWIRLSRLSPRWVIISDEGLYNLNRDWTPVRQHTRPRKSFSLLQETSISISYNNVILPKKKQQKKFYNVINNRRIGGHCLVLMSVFSWVSHTAPRVCYPDTSYRSLNLDTEAFVNFTPRVSSDIYSFYIHVG